ncbi:hypothetical protein BPAE_0235g00050 [Botrytis paeoniae]|uniref:Uncharacterized protein n=1 Tax=Botrytis paeoniae TaxID=278948 RepID=A0A4Z1F9V5_9HELO|nr:hypothetical protein BPAE_0235g00050 [Botrytis paeoniae]
MPNPSQNRRLASRSRSLDSNSRNRPTIARPFNLSRHQQNINAIQTQRRRFDEFQIQRRRRSSNPDDGGGGGEDEREDR